MNPPATTLAAARPAASRHPLAPLFQVGTVRLRCAQVLQSVERNLSGSFRLDRAALALLGRRVVEQLAAGAPVQTAPFWQALQAGGVDRMGELDQLLSGLTPAEQTRAWTDLAMLGVLLCADPGPRWRYTEQQALPTAAFAQAAPDELLALLDRAGKTGLPATPGATPPGATTVATPAAAPPADDPPTPATSGGATAATFGNCEGLAIAIFRAFVAGAFSADKKAHPCRVEAATLRHVDVAALRAMLQGTPQNAIQGLEGRATVLSRLAQLLQALPDAGGAAARPCDWVRSLALPGQAGLELTAQAGQLVSAPALLSGLLRNGAALWPNAPVQGLPAGDVWLHRWAGDAVAAAADAADPAAAASDLGTGGWVPLHAQGQALVAALALPLLRAGLQLNGLEFLTASAGPTTSALLLAAGVIVPRQARLLSQGLKLGDEAAIECRALTVALFEELTLQVRAALQAAHRPDADRLPVAAVVTATMAVWAGGGAPQLQIAGDGALF